MPMLDLRIPQQYRCTLTGALIKNPVKAADGNYYEDDKIRLFIIVNSRLPTDIDGKRSSLGLDKVSDDYLKELKSFYDTHKLCTQKEFIAAIMKNDVNAIKKLNFTLHYLECGADIHGNCALHFAAQENAIDSIDYILSLKINVDQLNHKKQTPLHVAAQHGKAKAVKALLNQGANKLRLDHNNALPIYTAFTSIYHRDALEIAKVAVFLWPQENEDEYQQALINMQTKSKSTMLHALAYQNNPELLQDFLMWAPFEHNLSPQDNRLDTPLHIAASFNSYHIIKRLLHLIGDSNIRLKDDNGNTAFERALHNGAAESAKRLLSYHKHFYDFKWPINCMHQAARNGYLELMKVLAYQGVPTDSKDDSGATPLHYAVHNFEIAHWLLKCKADPNSEDKFHQTPLIRASADMDKLAELYRLLIVHGANPHSALSDGKNQFAHIHDKRYKKLLRQVYDNPQSAAATVNSDATKLITQQQTLLKQQQQQYEHLLKNYQQLQQEHNALKAQVTATQSDTSKTESKPKTWFFINK